VQDVVLGVDRDQADDHPAVADDEAHDRDQQVDDAEHQREGPAGGVGPDEGQCQRPRRDVDDVVPGVDVEDPQDRLALDLVARGEARAVEEADDAAGHQAEADDQRVDLC